jgi:hexosaminidase
MLTRTYKLIPVCFVTFLALFAITSCKNNSIIPPVSEITAHGIIPLPKQLDLTGEKLSIDNNFTLVKNRTFSIAFDAVEELFSNSLESYKVSDSFTQGVIALQFVTDNTIGNNAYELVINSSGIQIKARNDESAFWAVQSLKQYFWHITNGKKQISVELPGIRILDVPKYEWRGFHLDVSRHMFTKEYIFKIIDWLSYYKFNKLHLHLTDDQGWRLESTKFPLLNEIGSWRTLDKNDSICIQKAKLDPDFELDSRFIQIKNGITMYGGFYSDNVITEIIKYANAHFIEVIPEIDMPGHMSAAIKAYPYLSCTDSSGWGTEFSYPICPCNDVVYEFVFQVYDEISELFPSKYIHIGADEVEKDTWKLSNDCMEFMRQNNLTNVNEIQSHFVENLQRHLESKGKTVIAWDDVTDGKFDDNIKIMYWRDWVNDAPDRAAANGNQIIFTRWDLFYLSSQYSDENLKKLLEFDIQKEYSQAVTNNIIGFQGCVWTEEIPSEAVFELQIFPRLQALSEVNWSGTNDWNAFKNRLESHLKYLNTKHIGYRELTRVK